MAIGLPRGLATAGIMAAVLFMGPAATVVPAQVPVQAASAGIEQPAVPTTAVSPATAIDPVPVAPELAPEPVIQAPGPLPWITVGMTVPVAPGDVDTPFSGVLAAPKADGLAVYSTRGGAPFGLLPARVVDSDGSERTWMPVVGSASGEWLQVLLPVRRNLPSTGEPVNGATGWVLASDVLTKASAVTVDVDLAAKTVTVSEAGTALAVYPVSISGGGETARGRSFVTGRYATPLSERCSAQPMMILSAQSETADGYFGQDTAVQAVHAFSHHCLNISGYTAATPGCIIINEEDIPRLLAIVPDGTPVTVRG